MQLFSELYGTYYSVMQKILSSEGMTEKEIARLVQDNAFAESMLFLYPKIVGQDGWGLVKNDNGKYKSILKHKLNIPFTTLEKRWLMAVLEDKRAGLFLDREEIEELKKQLDVKPLFVKSHFHFFDRFTDGDDFENEMYIQNFRTVLRAVHSGEILRITFKSRKGSRITHYYAPLKIEYSAKNDKFRAFVIQIKKNGSESYGILNISSITEIVPANRIYSGSSNIESFFSANRCKEPAVIKVSPERNGIERFLVEFAGFEKRSEIDKSTGICTAKLWYNKTDETEILIKILSFGPVVEILEPAQLRKQAQLRVENQYKLLFEK